MGLSERLENLAYWTSLRCERSDAAIVSFRTNELKDAI